MAFQKAVAAATTKSPRYLNALLVENVVINESGSDSLGQNQNVKSIRKIDCIFFRLVDSFLSVWHYIGGVFISRNFYRSHTQTYMVVNRS